MPTARNVLPVPAGPTQMVTSFSRRAWTYRPWPSVRGRRNLPPSITVRFCGPFRSDPARTTSRIVLTSSLVSWPLARRTARICANAPLRLAGGLLRAVDLDGVPAGHDPDAEGVPEQFQVLVAVPEEEDGLVLAVEREGARDGVSHAGGGP